MSTGNSRMVNQVRPRGQADGLAYSPQRDLAYIYSPMLTEVFRSLDAPNWGDYYKGWLAADGITEQQLADGVKLFCDAHLLFVGDPTIQQPHDAFERVGFWALPSAVRIMIFERIGEVIMGGFFVALRDVTFQGNMPPQINDIAAFVAAGRAMADHVHPNPNPPTVDDVKEELERTKVLLSSALTSLENQKKVTQSKIVELAKAKQDFKQRMRGGKKR
jgi:hypothetical protein